MSARLEVWWDGRHVGQFVFDGPDVTFVYDNDAPETPISLSLPRDRAAARNAARNFLENLLPEQEQTRIRMARVHGARSPGAFDLLRVAGGDIAGGLVLLPEGQTPHGRAAELRPALRRDIADRIFAITRDSADTTPRGVPARFSLAGVQGKFALAWVDRDWYWPNETVPSTHIVKPGEPRYPGIHIAEAAAMTLASDAGVPAPQAEVMTFEDQTAYVVERFDRAPSDSGFAQRLHLEDLVQGLGLPPEKKYDVPVRAVFALFKPVDPDGALRQAFLKQLAFSVIVGNADAHAKNYSLLLRPGDVTLSPLYDVVPLFLFPEVDQRLAMKIGGATRAAEVTPDHWRQLARGIGFDPDEMLALVREVAEGIGAHNDRAWEGLDPGQQAEARAFVGRNIDRLLNPGR